MNILTLKNAVTFLLLVAFSLPSMAAIEAGKILFARGDVNISNDNTKRSATRNDKVFEGDTIETGRYGIVQIHLSDGSLMSLRSQSEYKIEKQRYQKDAAPEMMEQAGELFSGWMRMVTGAIGKANPEAVNQRTVTTTIGIRGTVFQLIRIPPTGHPDFPGYDEGDYLFLEEGKIELESTGGMRHVFPGDVIFVPKTGARPRIAPQHITMFDMSTHGARQRVGKANSLVPAAGPRPAQRQRLVQGAQQLSNDIDRLNLTDKEVDDLIDLLGSGELDDSSALKSLRFNIGEIAVGEDFNMRNFLYRGIRQARVPSQIVIDDPQDITTQYVYNINGSAPKSAAGGAYRPDLYLSVGVIDAQNYQYAMLGDDSFSPGFGDMYYVIGDEMLSQTAATLFAGGMLNGVFRYDMIGASDLYFTQNNASYNDGDFAGRLTGGAFSIDLSDGSMQNSITLHTVDNTFTSLNGTGTITSFYDTGIVLNDEKSSLYRASVNGQLYGSNGEGLTAFYNLQDLQDSTVTFSGVAAYRQNNAADQVMMFNTLATYASFGDGLAFDLGANFITENRQLTYWYKDVAEIYKEISVISGQQARAAGQVALNDGTRINWGYYDSNQYLVDGMAPGANNAGHFLIADNVILDLMSLPAGLTGAWRYDYNGGTPITGSDGSINAVNSAFAVVDFESSLIEAEFNIQNLGTFKNSGMAGSIDDLYNGGVYLPHESNGAFTASLDGAFVGGDAQGIASSISISDYTDSINPVYYNGVATFERGNSAAPINAGEF